MRIVEILRRSFAAGALIGMGCIVYLRVGGLAGAILFSAGLFYIIANNALLFTGKCTDRTFTIDEKFFMLVGNFLGVTLLCELATFAIPSLTETAQELFMGQEVAYIPETFIDYGIKGMLCGICMWLATNLNGDDSGLTRFPKIIYGVVLFIMSGYTHSIALQGYLAMAGSSACFVIPTFVAVANWIGSRTIKFLVDGD